MAEHSAYVLGGILPHRKDLMGAAVLHLQPELFPNEIHRGIFRLLVRFYERTGGGVMPQAMFVNAIESSDFDTAKQLAFTQQFKHLADMPVAEADFRWAMEELKSDYAKHQTGVLITTGMDILEHGVEVNREFLKGHEDARKFLTSEIHKLERIGDDAAPEGNIFEETDAIMNEYVSRRDSKSKLGVLTGIPSVDRAAGGFQRGELSLVCAYTNQGKSQFVTQTAWDVAVNQGKNVLFATSETIRGTAIRRILARHSLLPQFEFPAGLNSSALKKGTLNREEEKVLAVVLDDWKNNPNYGKLNVVQVPRGATLDYVEQRLRQFGLEYGCDLVIEDYLALLHPYIRRGNEREEFNEILRNAKLIAVGYNDGEGVPFISPWAMKQEAYKEALKTQRYSLANLSDTSEAEKSSDQIIALFRDPDQTTQMKIQWLKMRDDAIPQISTLDINFRSTYIGDPSGATSFGIAPEDDILNDLEPPA